MCRRLDCGVNVGSLSRLLVAPGSNVSAMDLAYRNGTNGIVRAIKATAVEALW